MSMYIHIYMNIHDHIHIQITSLANLPYSKDLALYVLIYIKING